MPTADSCCWKKAKAFCAEELPDTMSMTKPTLETLFLAL